MQGPEDLSTRRRQRETRVCRRNVFCGGRQLALPSAPCRTRYAQARNLKPKARSPTNGSPETGASTSLRTLKTANTQISHRQHQDNGRNPHQETRTLRGNGGKTVYFFLSSCSHHGRSFYQSTIACKENLVLFCILHILPSECSRMSCHHFSNN